MQLDPPHSAATALAQRLHARHQGATAQALIAAAVREPDLGRLAVVSSFGAESVVLLHMLAQVAPDLPVLFIDTRLLFPETLSYQQEVAATLGLTNVQVIRASNLTLQAEDPGNTLHQRDTDACCDLRKTRVLAAALEGYESWITGRKRFQADTRSDLPRFEADGPRVKVNPLADWTADDLRAYIETHDLPRHPLVSRGYPSIGCTPCTTPVAEGEDVRAGRWRGQDKEECGIHFVDGRAVPGPAPSARQDANDAPQLLKRA